MTDMIAECERAAHTDGLAAGLAVALDGLGPAAAPGPVAAVPAAWTGPDDEVVRHPVAGHEGIAFVRPADRHPAPERTLVALGARLAAARLGATRRLTEHAVEHLSGRTAGGEPTIRKQLVLGTVADLLTALEALGAQLRVAESSVATVADVHDSITGLDWEAAKLLGASGFLTDSPGRSAHVSQLTANCWVVREGTR
ncbi:acyl-CoA dehydrogenase family protein [Streptomyces sp. NPDC101171]|uniref:acyl-CoA dehydrogenase family protein n=1 Tax=Streptomyces sp. NPDC101171 TaxID=3366122 RepID=UPI00382CDD64